MKIFENGKLVDMPESDKFNQIIREIEKKRDAENQGGEEE